MNQQCINLINFKILLIPILELQLGPEILHNGSIAVSQGKGPGLAQNGTISLPALNILG